MYWPVIFGRFRLSKLAWAPVALALWPLVAWNYRQRRFGRMPDEWYWPDALLYRHGWIIR